MPSPADLVNDDVLAEILLRLPPGSVLRSRAVCKLWRRVTTSPSFIVDYSRRRPPELLVYPDGYMMGHRARNALAAVDLAAGDTTCRRRLLRFHEPLRLVDSCDGLLLFAIMQRGFLVCNPATRQWAALPSPTTKRPCAPVLPSGFYFHRPSGEHRLLCIADIPPPPVFEYDPPSGKFRRLPSPAAGEAAPDAGSFYYILSTAGGGGCARRLGAVAEVDIKDPFPSACVAIRGTLYWSYHPEAGDTGGADMVAFDTAAEAFRRIPMPPAVGLASHRLRVFDMGGRLAMSAAVEAHPRRMDVWALEDEGGGGGGGGARWACLLRIDGDLPRPRRRAGGYPVYEAVCVLEGGALVVAGGGWVVLYDVEGKRELSRVDHSRGVGNVSRCVYRASLAPLPEPDARPFPVDDVPGGEPLLHYCSPGGGDANVPSYGNRWGRDDTWVVPNEH
ncbi:unnamed protein product [Urochloa decumbens]|uniref:F-box domain-containing protein n=1 Tax=Urochloa decumbens TaxID=240449 RepID=A0ABC9EN49_9POAL